MKIFLYESAMGICMEDVLYLFTWKGSSWIVHFLIYLIAKSFNLPQDQIFVFMIHYERLFPKFQWLPIDIRRYTQVVHATQKVKKDERSK